MNLKRYLRLGVAAIVVAALGIGVSGCQPPDNVDVEQSGAAQPESAQLDAVAMQSRERNKVGGSYGKNGVAPFGMAQRLPK